MVSETKLEESFLWDSKTGESLEYITTPAEWDHVLLLCRDCYQHAMQNRHRNAGLLRTPHDAQPSFHLEKKAGIYYELEEVTWEVLDTEITEKRSLAIAKAHDAEAAHTIRFFALNTPYYNAETKHFAVPYDIYATMQEQGVELRTRAWQQAEKLAAQWKEHHGSSVAEALKDQYRMFAKFQGFWSIWVTVFWQHFNDPALLSTLYLPDETVAPHLLRHVFPSTRRDIF